jgi:cysteine-rich repeat protein
MISNSSKRKVIRALAACVLALGFLVGFGEKSAHALNGKVLILDTTVSGGAGSIEATQAGALGFGVDVVSAATWGAMTAADFAQYNALILGDPTCVTDPSPAAPAAANAAVWSSAVTGNVIIFGTDEELHGKTQVTTNGISFATSGATTGAFISLSCYYWFAPATPVDVLNGFGSFVAQSAGSCFNDAHIVASSPALAGLTDAYLSGWGCSVHETFASYPTSTFTPLTIALEGGAGAMTFADGTTGIPYMLARGAVPVKCGDGIVNPPEACDDGAANGTCGDACSSICQFHWCGDGVVDTANGEQCDLGCNNGVAGGTCSSTCKFTTLTPPSCALTAINPGPPKQLVITVQDSPNGLDTITVTTSDNATVSVPAFSVGDTGAVTVVATKTDQTMSAHVALHITGVDGTTTDCDPVVPGEPASNLPTVSTKAPTTYYGSGGCNIGPAGGTAGLSGLFGALVGLAFLRRRRQAAQK